MAPSAPSAPAFRLWKRELFEGESPSLPPAATAGLELRREAPPAQPPCMGFVLCPYRMDLCCIPLTWNFPGMKIKGWPCCRGEHCSEGTAGEEVRGAGTAAPFCPASPCRGCHCRSQTGDEVDARLSGKASNRQQQPYFGQDLALWCVTGLRSCLAPDIALYRS